MIRALIVSMALLAAGTLVCPVDAQQQNQDQGSAAAGASTAAKPKSKKVWTNDNMGDVTGTISVVGTPQPKSTTAPSKISSLQPAPTTKASPGKTTDAKSGDDSVDPKTLAEVKQHLQKLQASIDQLDKQIEQLKGASRGDSKNLGGLNADTWSYSTASVPDQIKALEAKKSALQTSMDSLLDAARASGIEPGQLR